MPQRAPPVRFPTQPLAWGPGRSRIPRRSGRGNSPSRNTPGPLCSRETGSRCGGVGTGGECEDKKTHLWEQTLTVPQMCPENQGTPPSVRAAVRVRRFLKFSASAAAVLRPGPAFACLFSYPGCRAGIQNPVWGQGGKANVKRPVCYVPLSAAAKPDILLSYSQRG